MSGNGGECGDRRPGVVSVVMPSVAAMTQHIASSTTPGTPSDPDTPEDIQVARGDDAEGAVGSASPESEPVTADRPETLGGARPDPATSASKDPSEWVTGDEPITGPQASYLDTLAREANEEIPADITKAEASEQIDRLQAKTGRGR
jgi:hypothetical protein